MNSTHFKSQAVGLGALTALACACALCQAAVAASSAASPTSLQAAPGRSRNVNIKHVAIDLQFDWAARRALGSATLTLSPLAVANQVALDAGKLEIASVTLAGGSTLAFRYDDGERDNGLLILLDRDYRPSETLTLKVSYRTNHLNHSDPQNLGGSTGKGLRFFSPNASDLRKRAQIWSSAEPGANRYWMPGFDSPEDRHTSEFTATVPKPLMVVAQGRLVSVKEVAGQQRRFHFKTDSTQASHRMAFVVGEFVDVGASKKRAKKHVGSTLHNLSYPDELQATRDSVVLLPQMLDFFSQLTGKPLPHPSYTQVFVQDFPWGQSAAGLAVQSENMVDDHGTHADFIYLWDGLQAEALAQQWFGNHLSAATWGQAWLDRAFAHHAGGLWAEHAHGRDEHLLWQLLGDQGTALADWKSGKREAVVANASENAAAHASGNAPYSRGAAVLHMLRLELGDEAWRAVLRHYVAAQGGKAVHSSDFLASVHAVVGKDTGKNMAWFFDQWLHRADHPTFDVSYSFEASTQKIRLLVNQQPADGKAAHFQGHVDIDIEGRIQRVWLKPQAQNVFEFAAAQAPRWLHFDSEGSWLKELKFNKPVTELLQQLRHSRDAAGRNWALGELGTVAKDMATPQAVRQDILAGLRDVITSQTYWRLRFNALQQLRGVLTPAPALQAAPLDGATTALLLKVIQQEGSWMRAGAIGLLGLSQDARYTALYLSHLKDPSDRVINAAAIALGKTRSVLAFDALAALPAHPSWKNQSLISALAGLKELGDARGADIALRALADVRSARWTLSTPIWDYRLAAAQTLAALGQGASAAPLVLEQFHQAMAADDVNDIFSHALLLVNLGDARARAVFPALRDKFGSDANALEAAKQLEEQLQAKLK